MSHSILVSNVPANVSEGSVMRYIREMTGDASVVHMQPFPDQYHHVNDSKNTRTLQIFFETASEAAAVNALFQTSNIEEELAHAHDSFQGNSKTQVPRTMTQVETWIDNSQEGVRSTGRRISVTMI
ncbi:LANO_0E07492g1_1 [Lachancea nothofagi CBS 11611]|uniref:LANO_0E07492g1_1 n=1 Tax=Lachancea nothofagi CBS 11611 TaxID=1266666 RepID=A0A1G4JUL6_9SACH|nr:LANO_0E07492g1_1 [Lachancea nothofagi CBS 11611]